MKQNSDFRKMNTASPTSLSIPKWVLSTLQLEGMCSFHWHDQHPDSFLRSSKSPQTKQGLGELGVLVQAGHGGGGEIVMPTMKSKPVIGGPLAQGERDGRREEVRKAGGVTRR